MRVELGLGSRLTVLYSGNLGLTHDAGILVKAAAQFIDDDNVRFVIVGEGAQHDRLRTDAHARGVEKLFVFLPRQTAERLPLSMGLGDLSCRHSCTGRRTHLHALQDLRLPRRRIGDSRHRSTAE
jgi:hypothetical protein